MKQILTTATALLWAVVVCGAPKTDSVVCRIEGRVVGRPESKVIWAVPILSDERVITPIRIPIVDSAFSCTITVAAPTLYELTFAEELQQGSWRPTPVMIESGNLSITLHAMDRHEQNSIEGGRLNARYKALGLVRSKYGTPPKELTQQMDSLYDSGAAFSDSMRWWIGRIEQATRDSERDTLYRLRNTFEELSPQAKALRGAIAAYTKQGYAHLADQLAQVAPPTESDLATLCQQLYHAIQYKNELIDKERYIAIYRDRYAKRFAGHVLVQQIEDQLTASAIAPGAPYLDFEAQALDGSMRKLSSQIKGKVAVIDLWASWCGPCMRLSSSIIPVWERYKDRGFTVVGVAREKGNTQAMEKAVERLKLPWVQWVELNDRGRIWAQYGAGNSGGKVILVDKAGKIVAVNFSAAELEAHLEKLLAQ